MCTDIVYKRALSFVISISLLLAANIASAASGKFEEHWSWGEIQKCRDAVVQEEFSDESFIPEKPITRSEFAALVNKIFNYSGTSDIRFSDVGMDSPYKQDIETALAIGYMQGCGDGTFKPNNPITRQEVAVAFCRILQLDVTEEDDLFRFKDMDKMPQWSRGSINVMVGSGYMKGWAGYFNHSQEATNAEVLTVISRIIERKSESFEIRP